MIPSSCRNHCREFIRAPLWVMLFLFGFSAASAHALTFKLLPGISADMTYTDNLELEAESPQSDWITVISPRLDATFSDKTGNFNILVNPEYSSYQKYPEYDTLRLFSLISGDRRLSQHTDLRLQNTFVRTEEPKSDKEAITTDDTRRGRKPYINNNFVIAARYRFGAADDFTLSYISTILENEDELVEDQLLHNPSAELMYWISPQQLAARLTLSYIQGHFSGDRDDFHDIAGTASLIKATSPTLSFLIRYRQAYMRYSGQSESYQINELSLGSVWNPSRTSAVRASAGAFQQVPEETRGIVGFSGNLLITKEFQYTTLRIAADSGFVENYLQAQIRGFGRFYQLTATAIHRFSTKIESRCEARYRFDTYRSETFDRDDQLLNLTAGLSYRYRNWLNLNLIYDYRMMDSIMEQADYQENRIQFRLDLNYPQPWRKLL